MVRVPSALSVTHVSWNFPHMPLLYGEPRIVSVYLFRHTRSLEKNSIHYTSLLAKSNRRQRVVGALGTGAVVQCAKFVDSRHLGTAQRAHGVPSFVLTHNHLHQSVTFVLSCVMCEAVGAFSHGGWWLSV